MSLSDGSDTGTAAADFKIGHTKRTAGGHDHNVDENYANYVMVKCFAGLIPKVPMSVIVT